MRTMFLSAGALFVVLAACGSDDSNSGSTTPAVGGAPGYGGAAGSTAQGGTAGQGNGGTAGTGEGGSAGGPSGPVTLATKVPYAYRVAVDSTHVWFTAHGLFNEDQTTVTVPGQLGRVPIAGGTAEKVLAGDGQQYEGLAVDGANVFFGSMTWIEHGATMRLSSVPKAGGTPKQLDGRRSLSLCTDAAPGGIAAKLFYATDYEVRMAPLPGGEPTLLYENADHSQPTTLARDSGSLYVTLFGTGENPPTDGSVIKIPETGGSATVLIPVAGAAHGIAIDGTSVYATDIGGGDIWKVGKDGSGAVKLATAQKRPYAIVVAGDSVYWTNRGLGFWETGSCKGKGSIMKVATSGGTPVAVASQLDCPSGLAADDANIYWAEAGSDPKSLTADDGSIKMMKR